MRSGRPDRCTKTLLPALTTMRRALQKFLYYGYNYSYERYGATTLWAYCLEVEND